MLCILKSPLGNTSDIPEVIWRFFFKIVQKTQKTCQMASGFSPKLTVMVNVQSYNASTTYITISDSTIFSDKGQIKSEWIYEILNFPK